MPLPLLRRREFIAASAALVAAACGGSADGAGSKKSYELAAAFPTNEPYVAAGIRQRLPFLIQLAGDAPIDEIDGAVPFHVTTIDGKPVAKTSLVVPHSKDLPRAYLPYEVTVPKAGDYYAHATYAGQALEAAFTVVDPAQVTIPQVGASAPSLDTPTTTDARGVDPICTREPACPFHTTNLAEALRNGKPTILLIGTPLYCQTNICGPVLELLIDAVKGRGDLNVIHAEVYANPTQVQSITQATQAPIIAAYGLPFEPCLVAISTAGTVTRRLDLIWDRAELDAAVASVS